MPGGRQSYHRQMNRYHRQMNGSRQADMNRKMNRSRQAVVSPTTDRLTSHARQTSVVPPTDEPPGRRQSYLRQMNRSRQADVSPTSDR